MPVWVAAAAHVAAEALAGMEFKESQEIYLPDQDKAIFVPVSSAAVLNNGIEAIGISHCNSGLSLDITRNLEIWVSIKYQDLHYSSPNEWLQINGGQGVGKMNVNGQICISEFARKLLDLNLQSFKKPQKILRLEVIFPCGKKLAERTSNSSFGVVDGLALIGMQAEVKKSASPDQLQKTIELLKEKCSKPNFKGDLIFVLGENGLDIALKHGLNEGLIVKTGNWLGPLLVAAAETGVKQLLIWGYHGKLIKLAGGIFHTHHHLADARIEILIALAVKTSVPHNLIKVITQASSIESALLMMEEHDPLRAQKLWFDLASLIEYRSIEYVKRYAFAIKIGSVLFDRQRKLRWAGSCGLQMIKSLDLTLEV